MADRKYFVLCDHNCKFEGMTKEQILTKIAEATGTVPSDIDDAFITKIKEQNRNVALHFWFGTEAEYNALVVKNAVEANTIYCIKNGDATFFKNPVRGIDYWTAEDKMEIKRSLTPSDIGAASETHRQSADSITAGTFAGKVVANASGQTPSAFCLRNSKLVSAEENPTVEGEIVWVYE